MNHFSNVILKLFRVIGLVDGMEDIFANKEYLILGVKKEATTKNLLISCMFKLLVESV